MRSRNPLGPGHQRPEVEIGLVGSTLEPIPVFPPFLWTSELSRAGSFSLRCWFVEILHASSPTVPFAGIVPFGFARTRSEVKFILAPPVPWVQWGYPDLFDPPSPPPNPTKAPQPPAQTWSGVGCMTAPLPCSPKGQSRGDPVLFRGIVIVLLAGKKDGPARIKVALRATSFTPWGVTPSSGVVAMDFPP